MTRHTWNRCTRTIAAVCVLATAPVAMADEPQCTYDTFRWNPATRTAVARETVRHAYRELKPEERDALTGCTVCSEDQAWIRVPPLAPFRLCKYLAPPVRDTLARLVAEGAPIEEVIGYRVGRTRGDTDASGNRTGFSNHSFGIALDINPKRNGLYHDCPAFGPSCRLVRGGPWRPGTAGTLAADGAIVREFKRLGLRWGGEIAGQQKDFMHFSPSGY
jgi:hypothetical protein